ncbi:MAG: GNAT family N-acetyltransferase [bacterium]
MNQIVPLKYDHPATGSSIVLKQMPTSHIKHLITLAQDTSLIAMMGWDTHFERDDIKGFIGAIAECTFAYSRPSHFLVWGIYLPAEDFPIGYAILKGINHDLRTAEVGVAILDTYYRPKGYGRLVLQCTSKYAFEELGLGKLGVAILASNKSSINMCKRTGFQCIKTDNWEMPDGTTEAMWLMDVTRETVRF